MPDRIEAAAGYPNAYPTPAGPPNVAPVNPAGTQANAQLAGVQSINEFGQVVGPSPNGTAQGIPPTQPLGEPAQADPVQQRLAEIDAQLKERERNLVSGYNRKYEEMARKQKELDQQIELAKLAGQNAAQQAGRPGQGQRRTAFERMPPEVQQAYNSPEAQQAINMIGLVQEHIMGEFEDKMKTQFAPASAVSAAQDASNAVRQQRIEQEVQRLAPVYQDVLQNHASEIGQVLQAAPNMNLWTAMNLVAPDAVQAKLEAKAQADLVQRYQQQQQAAALEGHGRPSATPADMKSDPSTETVEDFARRMGYMG